MMTSPVTLDEAAVASFLATMGQNDAELVRRHLRDDCTWHLPPALSEFGSDLRGVHDILDYVNRLVDRVDGAVSLQILDLDMTDARTYVVLRLSVRRPSGVTATSKQVLVAEVEDGIALTVDQYIWDPASFVDLLR